MKQALPAQRLYPWKNFLEKINLPKYSLMSCKIIMICRQMHRQVKKQVEKSYQEPHDLTCSEKYYLKKKPSKQAELIFYLRPETSAKSASGNCPKGSLEMKQNQI